MMARFPQAAGTFSPATYTVCRRAWYEQGVAALPVADITDPWLRKAIINEATRRWGPRNGGHGHGR